MTIPLPAACLIALTWGILWALFLQRTRLGRWLAHRRTWLTVVAGVGVDLLIAFFVVPIDAWLVITAIISLSGIGIIARSILNELAEHKELERINADAHTTADERDQRP